MSLLKIALADDWEEVSSQVDAPELLVEENGRLLQLRSDFEIRHDFGLVGSVDCPITYDTLSRTAYRYVCASSFAGSDYSELRAFELQSGNAKTVLKLPLNQWVLWLLEWISSSNGTQGQLFGLLAVDRPVDDRIQIEHRFFALSPGDDQAKLRPLCRDAYRPLAFSRNRGELVFAGAEGIYLINLKGVRIATFPDESATGHGAAFDPTGSGRIVIGGDGLFLWDLERNQSRRLTRLGRHPVWANDRNGLWYRESSSDLFYYDLNTQKSSKVFGVVDNRNPELWYARAVNQTKCGRYLAASVTAKNLKGISRKTNTSGSRERIFVHDHELLVLDLKSRQYCRRVGFANHICWAE